MGRVEAATSLEMPKRHLLRWGIALLLIGIIAIVIAWLSVRAPRGSGLLHAFPGFLNEIDKDEQRIGQIILDSYSEYRDNARNWSAAAFGSLFLSAAFAAFAGLVIKLEFLLKNESFKKDLAAVLAMLAALLITLSTVGGFHQRWLVNRLAAAKMERLAYAFIMADRNASADHNARLATFSTQIQSIAYERNEGIVSSNNERVNSSRSKPPE